MMMLKLSKFIRRSIAAWVVVIGFGSLLVASQYANRKAKVISDALLINASEGVSQQTLALMEKVRSTNETLIWILTVTNLAWMILLFLVLYGGRKHPCKAKEKIVSDEGRNQGEAAASPHHKKVGRGAPAP